MTTFIFRRLLVAVPVAFIVLSLTFLLCRIAPGNPFSNGKSIRPEILAELEQQYSLHGPLYQQYGEYLWKVAHGNLSISTQYRNRSVNEIIAQTLPVSMTLGALAYLLALTFGIILGAWAAVRHNQWGDRALMLVALLGISIPASFVLAPLLVLWLALSILAPAARVRLGLARSAHPAGVLSLAAFHRRHRAAHSWQFA